MQKKIAPMMWIFKNPPMKIDSEITQMIELAVEKIKTLTHIFHILKKIEENTSMLKTDVEKYIKINPN